MVTYSLSIVIALTQYAAFGLATPLHVDATSLISRSQFCENSPLTVAGTSFDRRGLAPSSLEIRAETNNIIWCAAGTRTYVILSMTGNTAIGTAVRSMLSAASTYVAVYLSEMGDGVVSSGGVSWPGDAGVGFVTWNANNHQTTWAVLSGAITSLNDYMSQYGYGEATFTIADGGNIVGRGYVGIGQ